MTKYIVIVHTPAPAKPKGLQQASTYTAALPDKIQRVDARTPEAAAEFVNVPAGGYCEVIDTEDVRRFDRAVAAPLVEKRPDGNPLPVEEYEAA